MVNGKPNLLESLAADIARTVEQGMLAADRCLAGVPQPGDDKRVRSALQLSDMMREHLARKAAVV